MAKKDYKELINKIKNFYAERNWNQFHDGKNLALSLVLESSEALKLQWTQENDRTPGKRNELPNELAIDLIDALNNKIQKTQFKRPIEKAKGNSKKYNEL